VSEKQRLPWNRGQSRTSEGAAHSKLQALERDRHTEHCFDSAGGVRPKSGGKKRNLDCRRPLESSHTGDRHREWFGGGDSRRAQEVRFRLLLVGGRKKGTRRIFRGEKPGEGRTREVHKSGGSVRGENGCKESLLIRLPKDSMMGEW